jgi:hypothetical protein
MAFVAWRTWVAGAVVTAAQLNQDIRDNLNAWFPLASGSGVAWTAYTPTLTQTGTVTKTVTKARYTQIGKTVIGEVVLAVTGSGTGNSAITVSLPVTAASANNQSCGTGFIFDSSASLNYPAMAYLSSTSVLSLMDSTFPTLVASGQSGAAFSVALASPDSVNVSFFYEAA